MFVYFHVIPLLRIWGTSLPRNRTPKELEPNTCIYTPSLKSATQFCAYTEHLQENTVSAV